MSRAERRQHLVDFLEARGTSSPRDVERVQRAQATKKKLKARIVRRQLENPKLTSHQRRRILVRAGEIA